MIDPTDPEVLVHEPVDDRVDEAVGHGQPVDPEVDLLGRLAEEVPLEGDDGDEHMQGQPADAKQEDDSSQHLHHLERDVSG